MQIKRNHKQQRDINIYAGLPVELEELGSIMLSTSYQRSRYRQSGVIVVVEVGSTPKNQITVHPG
jgi:hypothetical protein